MKRHTLALTLTIAAALAITLLATGVDSGSRLKAPPILQRTYEERHATLDALRTAWENRPLELSPENERAERIFLNRVITFLNQNKRREIYAEACGFWNACYHDHARQYRDYLAAK